MAKPIMSHRDIRGSLVHQVQDVQFPKLKQALCAASAVHALHELQNSARPALATITVSLRDEAAISATSRPQAEPAAPTERIRRHRVPTLTDIRIRVARLTWGIVVEYVGPSLQQLHATGCVTDRMMELWGLKGGKKFRDENGDGFRRWPRRSRAFPVGVLVTRNIHEPHNYRALLGVIDCLKYLQTARNEARPAAQINTLQAQT